MKILIHSELLVLAQVIEKKVTFNQIYWSPRTKKLLL